MFNSLNGVFAFKQHDGDDVLVIAVDKDEALRFLVDAKGYSTADEMRADGWLLRCRRVPDTEKVTLCNDDDREYTLFAGELPVFRVGVIDG